ncbi:MAG: hypothetical protein A3G33_01060 [Omnitrophica bacterium RIFCSPLOWO2_12_FULL_44_17]|uniref:Cation:proton antiporter n=1 Tax=Candidatus Danuiimicrobium aquiferis TaxID=1801832 RepID=A0A1G1L2Y0_9BACT|nr:MAG: hypothetical protein A3B72_06615 [Omnitrophica bacterium RIFCSPHIGHO2_02_FULL_45_28]OGW89903.1 MAG: hypothetical protein A3E74_03645 [Omnitrophica bacterium RIFCSPHIGHO2_12_FULL_44_12]OGW99492.1 MAG: hypothetical protein A3G33_01060 [Omnitrophica bacterium RIFCSPLOWO2_12_FULL_44_17]OGX04328.1 MAG: hypothetical protein A3J12_00775 [Omnitrophica bacterium RIFCSPLOWO2_02_FULL_44_11]
MKSKITLFLGLYLIWCFLNWMPDWQHLLVGVLVAGLVTIVTGDLFVSNIHVLHHLRRVWYFLIYYMPVFVWECIKANLDVAYRVLHPMLPIRPGIVKIKTNLKTDTALTFLANSITLTPGTMSVDIDRDKGVLYIHWIHVETTDCEKATKIVAAHFEKILAKIFEEDV